MPSAPVVAAAGVEMFKWPWSKSATRHTSCSPMKDGWRIAAEPCGGMSFSDMAADLKSWGFEVCRKGNVQDIYHEGVGMGIRHQGCDHDEVLSNLYWGIRAGRESAALELAPGVDSTLAELEEAKQICTRLAIYIEQEEAKLRSMRHQIRQQVLYRGFETPEDSRMTSRANDLEDFIQRLKGALG